MTAIDVMECARRYLGKMPAAVSGSGGHNQTFAAACVLVKGFDLPLPDARTLLQEYNQGCQPPWSEAELEHKLIQADTKFDDRERGWLRPTGMPADLHDGAARERDRRAQAPRTPAPKPELDADRLRTFAARWRPFVDTLWLAERSPRAVFTYDGMRPGGGLSPDAFLEAVFREHEGERVMVFTNQQSQGQALWPMEELPQGSPEGVWYLCNPVDGMYYPNPRSMDAEGQPKPSRRSAESVTDWRHMVLENDEADHRDWLAALVQLPLRIVAIYTSGGKSIHALVRVDAPTEQEWNSIKNQLAPIFITLGADKKSLSAVRLSRLPGCWRGTQLQKLLYLNPNPEPKPIIAMERAREVLRPWKEMVAYARSQGVATWRANTTMWESIENLRAALQWFASSADAREALQELEGWMGISENAGANQS